MHLLKTEHKLPESKRWSSRLTILAGLFLVLCLGTMLIAQYRAQVDVYRSAQRHMAGDIENLTTLLAFYYGQCRKDVENFARSQPVGSYLKLHAAGKLPGNALSADSGPVKAAAYRLLANSTINNNAVFRRILITDEMGLILFDTHEAPQSSRNQSAHTERLLSAISTFETQVHADGKAIAISAISRVNGHVSGHVIAWLKTQTIFSQILSANKVPDCFNNLMSNDGLLYFPTELPEAVQSCDLSKLSTIPPGTISPLTVACDALKGKRSAYLAITLPIARTPLFVISMVPEIDLTGILKPWHYAIIMLPLTAIFFLLYAMQLRISRKHKALKTHYAETNRQHKIMVQNNEDLANEIILRKQAEAELKIINENLEEIVKHRTRKLESAMIDLKTTQSQLIQSGKLASIGELASGVAHELNQPLMVIRGNAQLMDRMLLKGQAHEDQLPAFFDTVERNTKRMILIINHLRTFSRQSGTERQPVDINQIINNAFLMIGEQLRLRNIKTITSLAENLPPLEGNPYQLEQVVLNLLTNARDAIESYRASENGYRRQKQIEITTRLKENPFKAVEIRFSDNGCGIQQEDKEKIFDPFFTTKAVGKGTGLGLSITYGILQEHNGSMEVLDSKPGQTTFGIVLPIK